jgi:hypothetical protein
MLRSTAALASCSSADASPCSISASSATPPDPTHSLTHVAPKHTAQSGYLYTLLGTRMGFIYRYGCIWVYIWVLYLGVYLGFIYVGICCLSPCLGPKVLHTLLRDPLHEVGGFHIWVYMGCTTAPEGEGGRGMPESAGCL